MLGISWFWFYGAIYLAQFAGFTRTVLGGDEHVVTLLLAIFSVGIGVGLAAVRAAVGPQGRDRAGAVRLDRPDAVRHRPVARHAGDRHGDGTAGLDAFLAQAANWRVIADLVLLGMFGGFYIVPLYALIQERSDAVAPLAHHRRQQHPQRALHGRVGGASRSACSRPASRSRSCSSSTALMNAAVALYIYAAGARVPDALPGVAAGPHVLPRATRKGWSTFRPRAPCIIVCNHVSFVDAVVIAACVRRPIRFVMDHRIFAIPVLKFIFRTMRTIPIAPAKEDAAMKDARVRGSREGARGRRDRRHLSRKASSPTTGELDRFRPGVAADLDDDAGAGRADGAARTVGKLFQPLARRQGDAAVVADCCSRIALVAGPALAPADATPEGLQERVLALRGDAAIAAIVEKEGTMPCRPIIGMVVGGLAGAVDRGAVRDGSWSARSSDSSSG